MGHGDGDELSITLIEVLQARVIREALEATFIVFVDLDLSATEQARLILEEPFDEGVSRALPNPWRGLVQVLRQDPVPVVDGDAPSFSNFVQSLHAGNDAVSAYGFMLPVGD